MRIFAVSLALAATASAIDLNTFTRFFGFGSSDDEGTDAPAEQATEVQADGDQADGDQADGDQAKSKRS